MTIMDEMWSALPVPYAIEEGYCFPTSSSCPWGGST